MTKAMLSAITAGRRLETSVQDTACDVEEQDHVQNRHMCMYNSKVPHCHDIGTTSLFCVASPH